MIELFVYRHKMITPGFIDVHSHSDLVPFMSGSIRESKIRQGVTTEVVGQCGLGSAPFIDSMLDWRNYLTPILGTGPQTWDWPNFSAFMCALNQAKKPNNIAVLLGHGAVRAQVLGFVKTGFCADLVVFDPEIINAPENYNNPAAFPIGLNYTLANGHVDVANGEILCTSAGKLI